MSLFPILVFAARSRDEYNLLLRLDMERAASFIILHYPHTGIADDFRLL